MQVADIEKITGILPTKNEAVTTAQIKRTRLLLESLLGFTLDPDKVRQNYYTETGKLKSDETYYQVGQELDPPDAVVFAYRTFKYHRHDRFFKIDPASVIHKVKLVRSGVTIRTLDEDEYRVDYQHGFIKTIQKCENCNWCGCLFDECQCKQLAIDATWLWESEEVMPDDLKQIWAEGVLYSLDPKRNIKSESLGPHSYTKFKDVEIFGEPFAQATIKKYAGGNGSGVKTITI